MNRKNERSGPRAMSSGGGLPRDRGPTSWFRRATRCGPCRVHGISTPLHQAFFDAVADSDKEMRFASLPFSEAMAQIAKIGANTICISHLSTYPSRELGQLPVCVSLATIPR